MGHKRRVVALWEPERTMSDDPVGMQQCDDETARSSQQMDFSDRSEHTPDAVVASARERC
eukprot:789823-Pleurochrysis_carterae.AAC.1